MIALISLLLTLIVLGANIYFYKKREKRRKELVTQYEDTMRDKWREVAKAMNLPEDYFD